MLIATTNTTIVTISVIRGTYLSYLILWKKFLQYILLNLKQIRQFVKISTTKPEVSMAHIMMKASKFEIVIVIVSSIRL